MAYHLVPITAFNRLLNRVNFVPAKGSDEIKLNKIEIVHLGGYVSFNHNLRYICPKWSTPSKVKPNSCLRQLPYLLF